MSNTYSKCRLTEMLFFFKREFQAKTGRFNHSTILGQIKSPKVFKKEGLLWWVLVEVFPSLDL